MKPMVITEKDNAITKCVRCGYDVKYTQLYYFDGECGFCVDCYIGAADGRLILSHTYRPIPIFCRMSTEKEGRMIEIRKGTFKEDKLLYLGIELEVENRHLSLTDYSYELQKEYGLYVKHDGSLDRGIELVSHPQTAKYHQKVFDWYQLLEKLRKDRFTSYDNGRCGLHIHVNKNFFYNRDDMLKISLFFYKCFNRLRRFSKRKSMNYCKKWKQSLMDYVKRNNRGQRGLSEVNNDRYTCINLLNKDTVEFRIYKGTLNYSRFLASILFTDAVCHFVKSYSVTFFLNEKNTTNILWNEFLKYIKTNCRYNFLEKYFIKHDLFNNKPAPTATGLPPKEDYLGDKKYKEGFNFAQFCLDGLGGEGGIDKYIIKGIQYEGEEGEVDNVNFDNIANYLIALKSPEGINMAKPDFVIPAFASKMVLQKEDVLIKDMVDVIMFMLGKSNYQMVITEDDFMRIAPDLATLFTFIGGDVAGFSTKNLKAQLENFIESTTLHFEIIRSDFIDVYHNS